MKLGLIAMSGVRAQDEELARLGLTLPGFVERNRIVASLPSLGLLTLAGMTPDDVDVEYLEVDDIRNVSALPAGFDLVAISTFSAQIGEAYQLADRYRASGVPVVLGGPHVSGLPADAGRHADTVVIGEGEPSWPRLVEDYRRGNLQPVYDSRPTPFDLAEAPLPRFDLLEPERYNRLTVQTQRGCPFDCEFCAASMRLAPAYKVKPVEKVIGEIRSIKEIWRRPFIEFADDNTFVDKSHSRKLMRSLAGEDVRWFTETDISVARDEELLGLMRDSGCAQVLIGLESPSLPGLRGVERHSDWKSKQLDFHREAIDRIQGHGISVNGCFVLGLDGTGPEVFQEVLEFVESSGLHEVQITIQTPFPGTPLYERLDSEGRLLRRDAWELCTLFDVNFTPDGMTADELGAGFRRLAAALYSEEAIKERRERFYRQLREARKAERIGRRERA